MINIGEFNTLRIDRIMDPGAFLTDDDGQDVLLPHKYLFADIGIDDHVKVFVYRDNMGRPIATTLIPHATVNSFASLEVRQSNKLGCFLDLGIEKDVLLPFNEQRNDPKEGDHVVVYIMIDKKTDRLMATQRLERHLVDYEGEPTDKALDILVFAQTPLGFKCVVDQKYSGLLYKNELKTRVHIGDSKPAYIKRLRSDGKLDLQLEALGFKQAVDFSDKLLDKLKNEGGFIPLHDKSSPEDISRVLGVSKKVFKQAVGQLYKARLIELSSTGIKLTDSSKKKGQRA